MVLVQWTENTEETVGYCVNKSIVAHYITYRCSIISMNLPSEQVKNVVY